MITFPLPNAWNQVFILYENQEYFLKKGRRILRFISLELCRSLLADVKTAVQLWEGTVKQDYGLLRKTIKFANGEISIKNKYVRTNYSNTTFKELESEYIQETLDENEKFIFISRAVLSQVVSMGLWRFPIKHNIKLVKDSGNIYELLPSNFELSVSRDNPMAYIWSIIEKELCGKSGKKWQYRRCADCACWVDLRENGRRSTWSRCSKCVKERKGNQGRERAARKYKLDKQKTSGQRKA